MQGELCSDGELWCVIGDGNSFLLCGVLFVKEMEGLSRECCSPSQEVSAGAVLCG